MDAYQDVCWNPCFRSISDYLSDLCIDLLGLGAIIAALYPPLNQLFFVASMLSLEEFWSIV